MLGIVRRELAKPRPLCYSGYVRSKFLRVPVNFTCPQCERSPYANLVNRLHCFAHMARKLFVGGLPYRTTNDELRDAFAQAGEVATASIVTDRETGRSRGFGFVEMVNDPDADAAISLWNGKEFGGRNLTVSEARPKAE